MYLILQIYQTIQVYGTFGNALHGFDICFSGIILGICGSGISCDVFGTVVSRQVDVRGVSARCIILRRIHIRSNYAWSIYTGGITGIQFIKEQLIGYGILFGTRRIDDSIYLKSSGISLGSPCPALGHKE